MNLTNVLLWIWLDKRHVCTVRNVSNGDYLETFLRTWRLLRDSVLGDFFENLETTWRLHTRRLLWEHETTRRLFGDYALGDFFENLENWRILGNYFETTWRLLEDYLETTYLENLETIWRIRDYVHEDFFENLETTWRIGECNLEITWRNWRLLGELKNTWRQLGDYLEIVPTPCTHLVPTLKIRDAVFSYKCSRLTFSASSKLTGTKKSTQHVQVCCHRHQHKTSDTKKNKKKNKTTTIAMHCHHSLTLIVHDCSHLTVFSLETFWHDKTGDIHLSGFNLHVIWL